MAAINEPPPDDAVAADGDEPIQRSRTSLKNERVNNEKALVELGEDLVRLPEAQLDKLGLDHDVMEAVTTAKKIKSFGARKRQLRTLRTTLRDADWTRIRRAVDHVRAGYPIDSAPLEPSGLADRWCEQLLIQGDSGLARFCEEFEDADRTRLRQLVRNVTRAPQAKRGKARLQLQRAVLDLVGNQP